MLNVSSAYFYCHVDAVVKVAGVSVLWCFLSDTSQVPEWETIRDGHVFFFFFFFLDIHESLVIIDRQKCHLIYLVNINSVSGSIFLVNRQFHASRLRTTCTLPPACIPHAPHVLLY